jgi:MoxR-like ATPase
MHSNSHASSSMQNSREQVVPTALPVSERFRDPAGYQAPPALESAVNVALLLGMPLLLTGEPGCGKTSVAGWISWRLNLPPPLVFNIKSTTSGRDLLYDFDEVARFRDAQSGHRKRHPSHYVRLNALGHAILLAGNPDESLQGFPAEIGNAPSSVDIATPAADSEHLESGDHGKRPFSRADLRDIAVSNGQASRPFGVRNVVLIDELDKAPRDTPNDLLSEILDMQFRIHEIDLTVHGDPTMRPIVVVTSNSERSLPEPFLRRCVFHHIDAPDDSSRRKIVAARFHTFVKNPHFDGAMEYFDELSARLGRVPGTAELLAWLTILDSKSNQASGEPTTLRNLARGTLGALAKTREDLELAKVALEAFVR